jgi:hypothetical protein
MCLAFQSLFCTSCAVRESQSHNIFDCKCALNLYTITGCETKAKPHRERQQGKYPDDRGHKTQGKDKQTVPSSQQFGQREQR